MDWKEIAKKSPTALKKWFDVVFSKEGVSANNANRGLYDFFDENGIFVWVQVSRMPDKGKFVRGKIEFIDEQDRRNHILGELPDEPLDRIRLENILFTKAFEVLNNQLNEANTDKN